MKKIIVAVLLLMCVSAVKAQTYERLSKEEIVASESYKSVAYNFVYAFICRDVDKLKELIEPAAYNDIFGGDSGLMSILNNKNIHDIAHMRHVIKLGYYPVVTICNDLDLSPYYGEGEHNPYVGCKAKNVRFDCVAPNGEFYDDRYGSYDTNVRVMLVFVNDKWRIFSFK